MIDLRRVLQADAIACLICGLPLALLPEAIGPALVTKEYLFGYAVPDLLRLTGIAVLSIGAWCAWLTRLPVISSKQIGPVFAVEIAWIIGSAVLVVTHGRAFTTAGFAVILGGGIAVLAFLALESVAFRGERRVEAGSPWQASHS